MKCPGKKATPARPPTRPKPNSIAIPRVITLRESLMANALPYLDLAKAKQS